MVRDNVELFWNAACWTALISTRLNNIDKTLSVEGESATKKIGYSEPAELWRRRRLIVAERLERRFVIGF